MIVHLWDPLHERTWRDQATRHEEKVKQGGKIGMANGPVAGLMGMEVTERNYGEAEDGSGVAAEGAAFG